MQFIQGHRNAASNCASFAVCCDEYQSSFQVSVLLNSTYYLVIKMDQNINTNGNKRIENYLQKGN